MLSQAAHGMAGNLLASTVLAFEHPVTFFPSMNRRIWGNRSVQRNVSRLRDDGHLVVEPVEETCRGIATSSLVKSPGLPSPARAAEIVAAVLAVSRTAEERDSC
jgi:phosphopantothenoylcysteine synthetase/decarboxylase